MLRGRDARATFFKADFRTFLRILPQFAVTSENKEDMVLKK
jgi:hypothetical protein